jgi:hypothetical protein
MNQFQITGYGREGDLAQIIVATLVVFNINFYFGTSVGTASRGAVVKSKDSNKSPDGSPLTSAGAFHAVKPKSRMQNFTTLV